MSNTEMQTRFELVLGNLCEVPNFLEGCGTLEIEVEKKVFSDLVKHWTGLPRASRPRLRGMGTSRKDGGVGLFHVILDAGARLPLLVISSVCSSSRPLPRLSEIWPHAAWWEKEISHFEDLSIEGSATAGETRWLPR